MFLSWFCFRLGEEVGPCGLTLSLSSVKNLLRKWLGNFSEWGRSLRHDMITDTFLEKARLKPGLQAENWLEESKFQSSQCSKEETFPWQETVCHQKGVQVGRGRGGGQYSFPRCKSGLTDLGPSPFLPGAQFPCQNMKELHPKRAFNLLLLWFLTVRTASHTTLFKEFQDAKQIQVEWSSLKRVRGL